MKLSGQSHDKNYELSKQFCHDFCTKPVKKHSKGAILSQFWSVFNEFHILRHHAAPLPEDETRPNLVCERGKT